MIFFINAAVHICNQLQNIRLQFPTRPALRELISAVEAQCHFPLLVDTMCLLDEYTMRWVELYSAAQLTTDCQVLVVPHGLRGAAAVRPESIPPATRTIACGSAVTNSKIMNSEHIHSEIINTEHMTTECRARAVFDALDTQCKGYLLYMDVHRAVDAQRRVFANYSAGALFALASGGRGDRIHFGQWAAFAATDPATIDALYAALPHSTRGDGEEALSYPGAEAFGRSKAILDYAEARLARDTAFIGAMRSKWEHSLHTGT